MTGAVTITSLVPIPRRTAGDGRRLPPDGRCNAIPPSGGSLPPAALGRLSRPGEAVERQEIEQPHERFHPLHDVGDRLRLQGMDGPQQGDGQSEARRRVAVPRGQTAASERAAHQAEQRQAGRQVDRQLVAW